MIQNSCHSCLDNPLFILFSLPHIPHRKIIQVLAISGIPSGKIMPQLIPASYLFAFTNTETPMELFLCHLHNFPSWQRFKGFCPEDECSSLLLLSLQKDKICSSKCKGICGVQMGVYLNTFR